MSHTKRGWRRRTLRAASSLQTCRRGFPHDAGRPALGPSLSARVPATNTGMGGCPVMGDEAYIRRRWLPMTCALAPFALLGVSETAAAAAADDSWPVRVKPSQFGLYTSTGTSTGPSMWRLLLGPRGSGGSWARPLGRYTWALDVEPNARVAEIVTASDWVQLVCAHPYRDGDRVLPNWADIAQRFDAVHFTLPVIAALQALSVRAGDAIIPAAYWDVETTFWLNWRFSGVHLLESPNA
jgi:hypothetical protein